METLLYTEQSIGKKPIALNLFVNKKTIEMEIERMKEILKYCSDPDSDEIENYTHSETGNKKSNEEVLDEMASDIEEFKACAQGLIRLTPKEEIINKMKAEISGSEYKPMDWARHFSKIPKKKDGTFAIGRVVTISEAHGFSYEDMEAYGRKGPEMVIKTFSDSEAHLIIRKGVIEKW